MEKNSSKHKEKFYFYRLTIITVKEKKHPIEPVVVILIFLLTKDNTNPREQGGSLIFNGYKRYIYWILNDGDKFIII